MPPAIKKDPAQQKKADPDVLYPDIEICGVKIPRDRLKVSGVRAKDLLRWEPEDEYKARCVKEDPMLKENAEAGYGEEYQLTDKKGNKIRCWANLENRPFTEQHALEIAQDILKGKYRLNLETIIISRTGKVTSGQHRLIGLILAIQMWHANKDKYKFWKEEPYIESLIACGGSDDPEVVRTIDNVRTRTETDVIYTSDIFKGMPPVDRRECSRMLAAGNDFLWNRTGAGKPPGQGPIYQTHSESLSFIDRHPKLLECVKDLFTLNKERAISKLKLSAGMCSGIMYLMGSSKTDIDEYRNADPPSEKALNWEMLDRSKEFWSFMTTSAEFKCLQKAIADLFDADPDAGDGLGGRTIEKTSVLSKAWAIFSEGGIFEPSDLSLTYGRKDNGQLYLELEDVPTFGGIDNGPKKVEIKHEPSEEEIQAEKERLRQERAEKLAAELNSRRAAKANGSPPQTEAAKPTTPPAKQKAGTSKK